MNAIAVRNYAVTVAGHQYTAIIAAGSAASAARARFNSEFRPDGATMTIRVGPAGMEAGPAVLFRVTADAVRPA